MNNKSQMYDNCENKGTDVIILGIESSCDDTSAAVLRNGVILSNITANQSVHEQYGGVVPELASRAHQQSIVPVVDAAIKQSGINLEDISAVAFTRGPGLMGSLLVGTSFAKGLAQSLNIPIIDVNHLHAHVMAHFVREHGVEPHFPQIPFLCLLVSGGNSQIIHARSYMNMEVIGQTIDDAAGEAFDKCAKIMGLPYPGGPHIDRLAKNGDENRFVFSKPNVKRYDYSFSGLKTSFLYTLRNEVKKNPHFIEENKEDIAASLQKTVIDILMKKLDKAVKDLGIKHIAVAGGVSANSGLRAAFEDYGSRHNLHVYIPKFAFTTDNAAMVAITGHYKYLQKDFADISLPPYSRVTL